MSTERNKQLVGNICTDSIDFRIVSSMEKVLTDRVPSETLTGNTLCALKGENVSFQIAYFWKEDRKKRGEISVAGNSPASVQIRNVELVPCAYPCHPQTDDAYLAVTPGLYPDLLRKQDGFGFPLITGQWRSIWIDFDVPEDAQAGTYEYEFEIRRLIIGKEDLTANGQSTVLGTVSVSLEIMDAVLPKLDIPHTEWFHCDCLANYYQCEVFSEQHWTLIRNFIQTAAKRNCSALLTPIFTPPLDTAIGGERKTVQLVDITVEADGSYTFGFDKFRRYVTMAKECGIQYFEISHLYSQWGAVATPKIMAVVDGEEKQIFGWDTKAISEEYRSFLHVFLTELKKVLEELKIQEHTFFHISDEPSHRHLEQYLAARDQVREELKEYRIVDALSDYTFYETGAVEEPICSNDHIEPFLAKRPKRLWTYYCTAQYLDVSNCFIVMPGYRTRILGEQIYKYHLDGFLHWGYNFYNCEFSLYPINPYRCTDADGAFPSGDPFLVYPGKGGIPEESLRLMHMSEGFNDYRAMKLLESLTDEDTVLDCLQEEKYGTLTFKKYPHSAAYITSVRQLINDRIKKALQK